MTQPRWSAWRVVLWFGVVSLAADMVYEGARSLYGPLLAALGASAALVGLVTGAGEAMALVLRLVFGPLADRYAAHWALTILGYGLTAVCVPLLAVTPRLGAAGLAVAAVLILLERAGKAVRSPSKSALLAHAAASVGRGRGFGLHKAMDQTGAFLGPLAVAAIVAAASMWTALAALAIPAAVAMTLLFILRRAVPDPAVYDPEPPAAAPTPGDARGGWFREALGTHLPAEFFRYAVAASLTTGGLVTFGLIGYHLTQQGLLPLASVPIVYAGAMLAEALAALTVGVLYDRIGPSVLWIVPVLVALVAPTALGGARALVLVGIALWGFAGGIQDSTIKAVVAELVEAPRRATAYGIFAGIQGFFAVVGGAAAGWLYERSLPLLVAVVGVGQLIALLLLIEVSTRVRRAAH